MLGVSGIRNYDYSTDGFLRAIQLFAASMGTRNMEERTTLKDGQESCR